MIKETIYKNPIDFDIASQIIKTSDSNYVFIGYDAGGKSKIYKIDENGDLIWKKIILQYGYQDRLLSIDETLDGDLITIGQYTGGFSSFGEMGITKFNKNGEIIWRKQYLDLNGNNYGYDIKATDDRGYIIASHYEYLATRPIKSWNKIIKTNPLGEQ